MEKIFIGQHLRTFLFHAGVTKADVVRATGCSSGFLSQVSSDKKSPGADLLAALYSKFKANVNFLLSGEGPVLINDPSDVVTRSELSGNSADVNDLEERIKQLETELAYARGQANAYKAMAEEAMSLSKTGGTVVKGMAKGFR